MPCIEMMPNSADQDRDDPGEDGAVDEETRHERSPTSPYRPKPMTLRKPAQLRDPTPPGLPAARCGRFAPPPTQPQAAATRLLFACATFPHHLHARHDDLVAVCQAAA